MDMIKNYELNTAAQANTALVPANNELSTAVQKPTAPAPADTEAPVETTFVDKKEQAPVTASYSEKKEEEKTKKRRKVEHCKLAFDENAIIVTKEFAKKASVVNTPEFRRLSALCKAYPHLTVIPRTAEKSTSRPSMKGLTEEFMKNHITTYHPNDLNIYQYQVAISKSAKSPHMYMRKWFIEHYPNWKENVILPDTAANT